MAGPGPGAQDMVSKGGVMMPTCHRDAHHFLIESQSLQQFTWDLKGLERVFLESVFEAERCLKDCSCFGDEEKIGMSNENFCEKRSLHPWSGAQLLH